MSSGPGSAAPIAESAASLLAAAKLPYATPPAFDLESIEGYEKIASVAGHTASQKAALASRGVVVTSGLDPWGSFAESLGSIFRHDLPLFFGADPMLHAMHRSYDALLKDAERTALSRALADVLQGLRQASGGSPWLSAATRADLDVYLAVAESLLRGSLQPPVAGGSAEKIEALVLLATTASGPVSVDLFGRSRLIDFGQMKPRGHYVSDPLLEGYFRCIRWLSVVDLSVIDVEPGGGKVVRRVELDAAMALHEWLGSGCGARLETIEAMLQSLVGEPDGIGLLDMPLVLQALSIGGGERLAKLSDDDIVAAFEGSGLAALRVVSVGDGAATAASPRRAIAVLPGRHSIDAELFSRVVYDRVKAGAVPRMLPRLLDVTYAALGNDAAAAMLDPELSRYDYASELSACRRDFDALCEERWQRSLTSSWLSSLRALSYGAEVRVGSASGVPAVFRSDLWARKTLGTQITSWAEQKRDNIAYQRPSSSSGALCEYPDAYVEPSPAFWGQVVRFGERGVSIADQWASLGLPAEPVRAHFERYIDVGSRLKAMAERQRTGLPLTGEQLGFLNKAVVLQGCVQPFSAIGWYVDLHGRANAMVSEPCIVDVHTAPTDANGVEIGSVLHAAVGHPRLLVLAVETCAGPRAYAGVVAPPHEIVTDGYRRVTDDEWETESASAPVADFWAPLLAR